MSSERRRVGKIRREGRRSGSVGRAAIAVAGGAVGAAGVVSEVVIGCPLVPTGRRGDASGSRSNRRSERGGIGMRIRRASARSNRARIRQFECT